MKDGNKFLGNMYGGIKTSSTEELRFNKNPSRVIGGLKAHRSHITEVTTAEGDIIEFPTVGYVTMLEEKIKLLVEENHQLNRKNKKNESKISSLVRDVRRLSDGINEVKRSFSILEKTSIRKK